MYKNSKNQILNNRIVKKTKEISTLDESSYTINIIKSYKLYMYLSGL